MYGSADRRVLERFDLVDAADRELLFRGGLEHSPIGLALTNLDGTFSQVNGAYARLLGYGGPEQPVGISFASVTHPDDAVANLAAMRSALESGQPYQAEKRCIRADGAIVHVLLAVTVVRDAAGQPTMFFTQVEDITERKAAEVERGRLAAMVGSSASAIVSLSTDGVIET